MSVSMVRDLYEYHRWANHRLFAVAGILPQVALHAALEGLLADRVTILQPGLDGRGAAEVGRAGG